MTMFTAMLLLQILTTRHIHMLWPVFWPSVRHPC